MTRNTIEVHAYLVYSWCLAHSYGIHRLLGSASEVTRIKKKTRQRFLQSDWNFKFLCLAYQITVSTFSLKFHKKIIAQSFFMSLYDNEITSLIDIYFLRISLTPSEPFRHPVWRFGKRPRLPLIKIESVSIKPKPSCA